MSRWSPEGGAALLDDGTPLSLPAEVLQRSAFRFLRVGQRLRLELVDGTVVGLGLPG